MSESRKSMLGSIASGVSNFILGNNEKDYTLKNVAKNSFSYAKPIFGHVSGFIESGKNSISDSIVWKDYHKPYISTEEAIDLASTTAKEIDNSEPEEFKLKYEEKVKSRSQVFSYPTPRLDSISEVFSNSKEKIVNSRILTKIADFSNKVYGKVKDTTICIFKYVKELFIKSWDLFKNWFKCGDQIILFFKKNWRCFSKKCNTLILSFRNNIFEYPKRFYHFIYGIIHSIYDKIYHYRHPEVHKSKISIIGNSIRNIGWSWKK